MVIVSENQQKETKMNLKKSIKQVCINEGIKQKDLAERLGIKPQQLNCIMTRNSMSLTSICKIAKTLDMKVSEFIALGE